VGDAVYELFAGTDYGWPQQLPARLRPYLIYEQPNGMAGILVYPGDKLSELEGDIFFCTFNNNGALHWSEPGQLEGFDRARRDRVIANGCSSGLEQGADGFLYCLSYTDGKLLRIRR